MYGKRARIGCLIPSTNTVVESEFHTLKPEGVSIHVTRLRALEVTPKDLNRMNEGVEQAAATLATAELDLILYACTSGSFLGGKEWEEALVARIEKACGVRTVTTSRALVVALEKMDVRNLVLVTPYTDAINRKEVHFLESSGFQVLKAKGLQKTKNTEIGRLEPEEAYDLARAEFIPAADGVLISCTDFRTIESIDSLEEALGVPVISSNLAGFWCALRNCGVEDKIPGYGRLLRRA